MDDACEMDAYCACTLEAIQHCMRFYGYLFNEDENIALTEVKSMEISWIRFISKLILRKSQWVRDSSVLTYFDSRTGENKANPTDEITKLASRGLVLVLGRSQMSFKSLWPSLVQVFCKDEWKMLAAELKLKVRNSDRFGYRSQSELVFAMELMSSFCRFQGRRNSE